MNNTTMSTISIHAAKSFNFERTILPKNKTPCELIEITLGKFRENLQNNQPGNHFYGLAFTAKAIKTAQISSADELRKVRELVEEELKVLSDRLEACEKEEHIPAIRFFFCFHVVYPFNEKIQPHQTSEIVPIKI